jgi:hypothetical protein
MEHYSGRDSSGDDNNGSTDGKDGGNDGKRGGNVKDGSDTGSDIDGGGGNSNDRDAAGLTAKSAVVKEMAVAVYRRGRWFVSSVSEVRIMWNITSTLFCFRNSVLG